MRAQMAKLRTEVAEACGEAFEVSGIYDYLDDEFWVEFVVYYGPKKGDDHEKCIDVKLTLTDSVAREGSPDSGKSWEGAGVLFDVVHYGGAMLGGYSPDNFTSRVWSKDIEETLQRLNFDVEETAAFIWKKAREYQTGERK